MWPSAQLCSVDALSGCMLYSTDRSVFAINFSWSSSLYEPIVFSPRSPSFTVVEAAEALAGDDDNDSNWATVATLGFLLQGRCEQAPRQGYTTCCCLAEQFFWPWLVCREALSTCPPCVCVPCRKWVLCLRQAHGASPRSATSYTVYCFPCCWSPPSPIGSCTYQQRIEILCNDHCRTLPEVTNAGIVRMVFHLASVSSTPFCLMASIGIFNRLPFIANVDLNMCYWDPTLRVSCTSYFIWILRPNYIVRSILCHCLQHPVLKTCQLSQILCLRLHREYRLLLSGEVTQLWRITSRFNRRNVG